MSEERYPLYHSCGEVVAYVIGSKPAPYERMFQDGRQIVHTDGTPVSLAEYARPCPKCGGMVSTRSISLTPRSLP